MNITQQKVIGPDRTLLLPRYTINPKTDIDSIIAEAKQHLYNKVDLILFSII